MLLRLVEGASGRGAWRSVTVCCANQRLQRDADGPAWATAAVPETSAGGRLSLSLGRSGVGPQRARAILGSTVKSTEEASQTQEKEEGKTELFCDP